MKIESKIDLKMVIIFPKILKYSSRLKIENYQFYFSENFSVDFQISYFREKIHQGQLFPIQFLVSYLPSVNIRLGNIDHWRVTSTSMIDFTQIFNFKIFFTKNIYLK